ncbi:hypothetical protein CWE27_01555 [Streptomyces sp. EAG2]|nr:hypothetical protein CWE27_01555 [Streptomyces sp. EAG2]
MSEPTVVPSASWPPTPSAPRPCHRHRAAPRFHDDLTTAATTNHRTNLRAVRSAASDHHGTLTLYLEDPANLGHTTIVELRHVHTAFEVKTAPLADLLSRCELATTRIIKIDVEGAEAAAVRGLLPALTYVRDDAEIVVEVTPTLLAGLPDLPEAGPARHHPTFEHVRSGRAAPETARRAGHVHPHDRRTTSRDGNTFCRSRREPATLRASSRTRSTAARAIVVRSEATVVRGGSVRPASLTSSKPATRSSPGTSMRSSRAARSTPIAWSSVAQTMAGGRSGPARRVRATS